MGEAQAQLSLPLERRADTSYAGASTSAKELARWTPMLQSIDAELLSEQGTLVARSRDLTRNHGIAAGGIQTLVDNVVGRGLRLRAIPDWKALGRGPEWAQQWSQQVEALWREHAESQDFDAAGLMNFHVMTTAVFRYGLVSGEALAVPLFLDGPRLSRFRTAMQLIEPDRLSNPRYQPDTARMRSGVEINRRGRPVAYHIRRGHPGDRFWLQGPRAETWERVMAYTPFGRRRVVHVFEPRRAGQHRGEPILAPILTRFKMLDHLERTVLQTAVINSMIAAFVQSPLAAEEIARLFGNGTEYVKQRGEWTVKLEGGRIIPLFPGDKVESFNPGHKASDYEGYVNNLLQGLATALNMPFELLMKDFSRTNYSSARAALLEAWRFFNGRRQWLVDYWCRPVYLLWLEEAVNRGFVEAPGFYEMPYAWSRSRWTGPGRGQVDPVKESQSSILRMKAGTSTLERECDDQGMDWEENLEQLAREKKRMEDLGLEPASLNEALSVTPPSDNEQPPAQRAPARTNASRAA